MTKVTSVLKILLVSTHCPSPKPLRHFKIFVIVHFRLTRWLSDKTLPTHAGDPRDAGLIPGSGRCPGVGNGNPLQHFCLKNSMERGDWWAWGLKRVRRDWVSYTHADIVALHF